MNFSAKDIINVEIISTKEAGSNVNDTQTQSKVIVKRPIAKRAGRSFSESVPSSTYSSGMQSSSNFKKPVESAQQQSELATNGKMGSSILYLYKIRGTCY